VRPSIRLRPGLLRSNVSAWRAYCGVPLRAVVKADGYGWGASRLVSALDDVVQGYCVADLDEFRLLRAATRLPIVIFDDVPAEHMAEVLEQDGLPNVSALDQLLAADAWAAANGRRPTVRVALRAAVGWSGIGCAEASAFAHAVARCAAEVLQTQRPDLTLVYLPHLDYDPQRFGPQGCDMKRLTKELDEACIPLLNAARVAGGVSREQ